MEIAAVYPHVQQKTQEAKSSGSLHTYIQHTAFTTIQKKKQTPKLQSKEFSFFI